MPLLTIALLGKPRSGKTLYLKKLCACLDEPITLEPSNVYEPTLAARSCTVLVCLKSLTRNETIDLPVRLIEMPWHAPQEELQWLLASAHLALLMADFDADLVLDELAPRLSDTKLTVMTPEPLAAPHPHAEGRIEYCRATMNQAQIVAPIELMINRVLQRDDHFCVSSIVSMRSICTETRVELSQETLRPSAQTE